MKNQLTSGSAFTLLLGCGIGVVFCVGLAIGFGFGSASDEQTTSSRLELTPEMVLRADASTGGEKVGLATGEVTGGMEALFALDYTTGDLFCWVLNPKAGPGFQAKYMTNVQEHLNVKKGEPADYIMTTGRIDSSGVPRQGNTRPAECVCYVADGNTGRVAGFTFFYSATRAAQGGMQAGELTMVCGDETRGNIQRD